MVIIMLSYHDHEFQTVERKFLIIIILFHSNLPPPKMVVGNMDLAYALAPIHQVQFFSNPLVIRSKVTHFTRLIETQHTRFIVTHHTRSNITHFHSNTSPPPLNFLGATKICPSEWLANIA